jgi:transposase
MALSMDLRQRVIAALDANESRVSVARRFCVSNAWLGKLLRQRRATGSIEPLPHAGGTPPRLSDDDRAALADRVLCPLLRAGDVVVMDNLSSHKVRGVREAVERAGASVRYLPPYSPDLSPIEPMWSKVKQWLRSAAARTAEALEAAIAAALAAVTPADARGYFRHCGYRMPATATSG